MKKTWQIRTLDEFAEVINDLEDTCKKALESGTHVIKLKRLNEGRTLPQNSSLHLYCKLQAEKMNDAGYTQRQLIGEFKEGFELPVTEHMVKEVFREVGRAMFGKESTADLSTTEIQEVYDVVDLRFGEITGIKTEWPSKETLMWERYK